MYKDIVSMQEIIDNYLSKRIKGEPQLFYQILKIKHIQTTTDKAMLVLDKDDTWFWIPKEVIVSTRRSKKYTKLTVLVSFKKTPIPEPLNSYFG